MTTFRACNSGEWAALAALIAMAASCHEHRERIVVTELPAAPGLKENAQVIFRGVDVGSVERLTLAHSGVRLVLRIRRADAPLLTGDRVALRAVGMFGDAAVEIVPGPSSAPPLGDSTTLAAVPPDTFALAREAAAQAVAKAKIAEFFRRDSVSPTAPTASRSRP
jgi:ABC-type transporter Mla subunit MlaD